MITRLIGFGSRWIDWISRCLTSSFSSLMVNEIPTKEFQLHSNLRQGNPLSLFLFISVMEGLHATMDDALVHGLFCWAKVAIEGSSVSHFFYVGDALFKREWNKANIANLVILLKCFYIVSGVDINLQNSNLLGIGVLLADVQNMAIITACRTTLLLFKHLDLLVALNMLKLDKFKSRMSKWKTKMISIGGRFLAAWGYTSCHYLKCLKLFANIWKRLELDFFGSGWKWKKN